MKAPIPLHFCKLLLTLLLVGAANSHAATITKANNTDNLNLTTSWVGSVVPSATDVALWNNTVAGANSVVLGADASWRGLSIANPGGAVAIGAGNTLTLGPGGVDMSAASQNLTISSGLTLGVGDQLWNLKSAGVTLTINGTFARSAGATLSVTTNASGGIGTLAFGPTLSNSIVGQWAIMTNSGAAANNSANGYTYATVAGGNTVSYLSATAETGTGAWGGIPSGGTGTINYDISSGGGGSLGATGLGRNVNTMRYTGNGVTQPGNINPSGDLMTANGIMNAGTGTFIIGGPGGSANNYGVNVTIGASRELVLAAMTAGITLRNTVKDNGAGASAVTILGNSTVGMFGVNTYSGGTILSSGNLDVGSDVPIGTGGFTIKGGSITPRTAPRTITNNVTVGGDFALGTLTFNNIITLSGAVDLGAATRTINVVDTILYPDAILSGILSNGGLTKTGAGTLVLSNANTYTGPTTVSAGTLEVNANQSSANGAVNVASAARLRGLGTVGGNTTVNGGLLPGTDITVGTLTFSGNLNLASATNTFRLSTSSGSGNDQVVVGGTLTLDNTDTIHINALGGASPLDTSANYVLFSVTTGTTMSTTPSLVFDGTPPSNAGSFQILKVGNNVVLNFITTTPPAVSGTANPDTVAHNQTTTITATVTPGPGTVTNVTVNLLPIAGSAAASLVLSNNNVYTNTFTVAANAPVGSTNLTVIVADNLALSGNTLIPFTVSAQNYTWDGGSALNNNWSSGTNWTGEFAPGTVGDSVTFDGSTRLTPNLDANYSVTGVTFAGTAGSFDITNAANTLTLASGSGVLNNSGNPQTFNVPVALAAAQTFDTALGDMTLARTVSGANTLTKQGSATLTFTGGNTFTGSALTGSLIVKSGTAVVDTGGSINTANFSSVAFIGSDNGTLTLKGTGTFTNTADFNVGDSDTSTGTMNVQDSAVLNCSRLYVGSAYNTGSTAIGTVNQTGGTVIQTDGGFGTFAVGGRNNAGTGTYNMSGGTLTAAGGIRVGGSGTGTFNVSGSAVINANGGFNIARLTGSTGTLNLNGGTVTTLNLVSGTSVNATNNFNGSTVKPTGNNTSFMSPVVTRANVRNGGAIIDTAGFNITITPPLEHSDIGGDNATDGGLTKNGNGTLYLNGVNTYTGPTVVNAGTLGGSGTIAAAVTVNSGAGIAPGNSIGTLTINGNLTLNPGSTNTFEVNGSTPANDMIVAGASVTYGGVLNIVPGGTFTNGQTFTLLSGTGATNLSNFASIAGSPGAGLGFTFTNGVLSVVTTIATNPTNITFSVSGGTLSLSWPADHLGWVLQSQTNALNVGIVTNSSAWFDWPGSASVTSTNIPIAAGNPTVFFRLRLP